MDKTLEAVLTFAGTAGGSAFLVFLFKGVGKWLSGAAHREQVKNTSLAVQRAKAIKERDDAEKERDHADDLRREAEEHVSILKRQIHELGVVPRERPVKE
ncbi:hypothetical protein SEA_SLOOPYJOE_29 [Arthrobacter phage Sloopyjoe]|nr:hypothetical protein PBI_STAYER_29 [Arthrobacter phage Stayer]QFG09738.1 hypothetical protein PBI_SHIBA_29 [Arthrobacter phage Shiba]QFG10173.1 hypothetical protein PBI_EGAD_29 [Arthrobacter phage Egad]QFG11743.1 hypothetical protein PBI_SALK_29 [Arthrobacter phage Salk]QFG12626.1 hypothetical protein PBI_MICHELLE_29 [Arthrobacter phage Michelle]QFG14399.1 hypothetical protein PBI_STARLORD_29 [Arthrobacter phage StarLord]UVT31107.1 hypothetical protein PBI_LINDA_29 [Arthrobacter phage Lind